MSNSLEISKYTFIWTSSTSIKLVNDLSTTQVAQESQVVQEQHYDTILLSHRLIIISMTSQVVHASCARFVQ